MSDLHTQLMTMTDNRDRVEEAYKKLQAEVERLKMELADAYMLSKDGYSKEVGDSLRAQLAVMAGWLSNEGNNENSFTPAQYIAHAETVVQCKGAAPPVMERTERGQLVCPSCGVLHYANCRVGAAPRVVGWHSHPMAQFKPAPLCTCGHLLEDHKHFDGGFYMGRCEAKGCKPRCKAFKAKGGETKPAAPAFQPQMTGVGNLRVVHNTGCQCSRCQLLVHHDSTTAAPNAPAEACECGHPTDHHHMNLDTEKRDFCRFCKCEHFKATGD